jgi:uncharacterized membrane protein YdjX (TVP38/TMEM64 family)
VAIAEPLADGLKAWRRGNYAAAAQEFEWAAEDVGGAEEELLAVSLARLAAALDPGTEDAAAATLFLEAETGLGAVPDVTLGVDVLALRTELAKGLAAARHRAPTVQAHQRLPLGATLRFLSLFALLGAAVLALRFTSLGEYLDRERLVGFFDTMSDSPWAPLALVGLYVLLAPTGLPMTPLIIAGGIVFGRFQGALVNIVGCVLGAAVSFQFAKLMGRDFVRRIAGKRLKRVETLLRRHGFWTLVGVRFMPVPFPVVNFGAALAGVRFGTFVLSAIVGLTPALLIYTSFASGMFDVARGGDRSQLPWLLGVFALVVALSVVPVTLQQRARRRRYHRLLAERQVRRRQP